jgi:excisionase family DNA binding protein
MTREEQEMADASPLCLRATQAARRLGITTRELVQLIYERKIRYVMVDGIASIPPDAIDEYRTQLS